MHFSKEISCLGSVRRHHGAHCGEEVQLPTTHGWGAHDQRSGERVEADSHERRMSLPNVMDFVDGILQPIFCGNNGAGPSNMESGDDHMATLL